MSLSEYRRSAGSVHSLGVHLVWCPKYRRPVLVTAVARRLRALIVAKCAEQAWTIEALEIMPDHVHLVIRSGPKASPAHIAHQIKGSTSHTLRREFRHLRSRMPTLWSKSYFVASIGRVSETTIRRYIAEQSTIPTPGVP